MSFAAVLKSGAASRRYLAGAAFMLAIGLLTVTPIIYVLVYSFDVSDVGKAYRFGVAGWIDIFTNSKTWSSIVYSFILSARIPLATVVGFGIAWLLVRANIPGSRYLELAFWFTFLLPS